MFNFIQHLFTARALQSENSVLKDQVKKLEVENQSLLKQVDELKKRIVDLESTPIKRPKIDYSNLGIV